MEFSNIYPYFVLMTNELTISTTTIERCKSRFTTINGLSGSDKQRPVKGAKKDRMRRKFEQVESGVIDLVDFRTARKLARIEARKAKKGLK